MLSLDELSGRWFETQLLLRSPLTNDGDIDAALEAVHAGLMFIDRLGEFAIQIGESRGVLLRWVLPFDASTSVSDQSNVTVIGSFAGAGTGSATTPELAARFEAAIKPEEKALLVDGALALRKLVRVKLSDEADLKQGLVAANDTQAFLKGLVAHAEEVGSSPFTVLATLS
jgi:hypothetical protein